MSHILTGMMGLPCGCVAFSDSISKHMSFGLVAVACPWCAAVFRVSELREWFENADGLLVLFERPPRTLIKLGDDVLEVVGQCDCGSPLTRERGSKETTHLSVHPNQFETLMLRN